MTRSKRSPVERAAFLVLSAALIAGAWICIDRAAYPVTEPYQFPITTDSPEWAALAEAVGITPQYLSYILNGTRSGKRYIEAIARVLELDQKQVGKTTAA